MEHTLDIFILALMVSGAVNRGNSLMTLKALIPNITAQIIMGLASIYMMLTRNIIKILGKQRLD